MAILKNIYKFPIISVICLCFAYILLKNGELLYTTLIVIFTLLTNVVIIYLKVNKNKSKY